VREDECVNDLCIPVILMHHLSECVCVCVCVRVNESVRVCV